MALLTERSAPAARRSRFVAGVGVTLASVLILVGADARPLAQEKGARASEYDLKAVFLYQFARFVDWPPEAFEGADQPLTIGVLGVDPFGKSLDEIVANEVVGGRKLAVRRYHEVPEKGSCQILFISDSEAERLERVLATLKGRSVLTVGDIDAFASRSGMIEFLLVQDRLRLRVNLAAANAAHLKISSQLLRQAQIVNAKVPRP